MPKGDALAVARIAGIMGAKRTPDLVPLCHPIALHGVTVDLEVTDDAVEITATARTADRTGVEMEALTSVAVAGLTMIDMVKAVDPRASITDVRLLRSPAARAGTGPDERELPADARRRRHRVQPGRRRRLRGPQRTGARRRACASSASRVEGPHVRPDDVAELEAVLRAAVDVGVDVVLTTGGTGLSPTDVTPEATRRVLDREAPGHRRGGPPVRRGERRRRPRCSPAAWPARPAGR